MNVGIIKQTQYDKNEIKDAIYKIVEVTEFPTVRGKKVLVKPNILSDSKPSKGITTNPVFVDAFLEILNEMGADKIYIGDSPGLHNNYFKGKNCGIYDVAVKNNAEFYDFTSSPVLKTIDKGLTLPVTDIVDNVDIIFSLAKFKTHQLMYSTGCVKNMFGVVPSLHKSSCHLKAPSASQFAKLINNLVQTVKPDYSLMDGIIGMEGSGPANGTLRQVGLILGSSDPYAVDYAQAVIMGYKIDDVPIIKDAKKRNLTSFDFKYPLLDLKNLIIEDYRKIELENKNLFNALILPFFTRFIDRKKTHRRPSPVFIHDTCIACKKCIDICPAKALSYVDGKIDIDNDNCIRCYCCHEMCPVGAIEI